MSRRKRKVRVAFKKNREKRARPQNLTHKLLDDDAAAAGISGGERISGKGDLTRYRTVMAVEDDGRLAIDVDESACLQGRVLRSIGANRCDVQTDDGALYRCSIRRVVRTLSRDGRNAVVAGDVVLIQPSESRSEEVSADEPPEGVIERVEPRRSVLSREADGHEHVIVSNVDQAVIVCSAAQPDLKPALIDRFLVSCEKGNVEALVCINKVDLVDPVALQPLLGVYGHLGYRTLLVSAETGYGIDVLRERLRGRESVLTGQSGVGKTSLLNTVQPGLGRSTATVSADSGKGRHTTRIAELLPFDGGGWVVDTPGIRQLQLWDVAPEEVEGYFIEFRPFVARCRFPDCTHRHEEACGVKWAVSQLLITSARYQSYVRIVSGD